MRSEIISHAELVHRAWLRKIGQLYKMFETIDEFLQRGGEIKDCGRSEYQTNDDEPSVFFQY